MESRSGLVLRRESRSVRFQPYPYDTGSRSVKEEMKVEVVGLGVELSAYVAQSMFLLHDDWSTLTWFCSSLLRHVLPLPNPVLLRLNDVMRYVYLEIQPDIAAPQKHDARDLIKEKTWTDFACGIIVLDRLVSILRRKDTCFDDRLLSSAVSVYKQQHLKNLDDKLASSKANGFVRETIKSNISHLWKSLFEEDEAGEEIRNKAIINRLKRSLGTTWDIRKMELPMYHPYILGRDFAKEEMKKEAVRLGLQLSLYVAQLMFLLSDDLRSVIFSSCKISVDVKRNSSPNSPVADRLLRVIHSVYLNGIKPKNGVYRSDGISVQLGLATTTRESFGHGFIYLDRLVSKLGEGGGGELCWSGSRVFTDKIEDELKLIEDKLRSAKDVCQGNGFRREAIESSISGLWKTLFDKEAKEATQTLAGIKASMYLDLLLPILDEVAPP